MHKKSTCEREGKELKRDFFNKFNLGTSNFVTPGKQLEYVSECKPDSTAVICLDKEQNCSVITWHQLHVYSSQLAWYLIENEIGPGSIVLTMFPNSIEHIIAVFAIWKTGACYMPMSYKAAESEIREACDTIHPNAAFAECKIPGLKFCLSADEIYEAMEGRSKEMPSDRLANQNMISLSGGTSGKMKFIRQNLPCGLDDETIRSWSFMSGMGFEQRQLLVGPLFHGAPHSAAFNGLFMGNTLVLTRNLCPGNILNMIKKYKIEFIQMVPTLMNRLAKLEGVGKEDFASLKALCHTGGVCSPWLKQIWIDLLGPEKIYEMYSMTECIGLTCIRGDEWVKHPGSIGRPVGDCKVSIQDENGREVAPLEIGEIYMTAPASYLVTEYINWEPLEVKEGGFRSVGDIGYVDEQGYLYFSDRRSDMLVSGGENVFATEVETALLRYKDILDAVVVGIPDEDMGRRLHAVIESGKEIPAEELKTFLGQYLTPYKIPKTFEFVRSIRRGDNGKADRKRILEDCIARGV